MRTKTYLLYNMYKFINNDFVLQGLYILIKQTTPNHIIFSTLGLRAVSSAK